MVAKIIMLVVFFAVMIGVGLYCRKHATDVNGFVLGGRSVGPWLTAFAYGTSYFSAVIFIGYAGQFGWKFGIASTWIGIGNAIIGSLLAWVILGRRTRRLLSSVLFSSDFFSISAERVLRAATSAFTASASSLLPSFIRPPIWAAFFFCSARQASSSVWRARLFWSRTLIFSTISLASKFLTASFAITNSGFSRSSLSVSILYLFKCYSNDPALRSG